ncbi:unnamed protein product [Paramecium primaurelia]|uniref:Uncharacterized protein n=1 Tax=Paramecium primaurelia TaxID=5886 RepID=A0A8S1QTV0_PARPR|nr:unnamed protein product [Paramecium primaurelia]CAD8118355.1 unnamed protein product [Paramecium primaurelia]
MQRSPNQKVTHICTYNNDCQKKLCDFCLKCHSIDVPFEYLLTIEELINRIDILHFRILRTEEMLFAGYYGLNKNIDIWKFQGQHEIINQLQQTIIEVNFFDEIGIKFLRQNIQIMKQCLTSIKQSLQAGRETMIYQYGILNVKDKMQEQVDQRLQDWDMDRIINSTFLVHHSSFNYLVLAKLNTKKD